MNLDADMHEGKMVITARSLADWFAEAAEVYGKLDPLVLVASGKDVTSQLRIFAAQFAELADMGDLYEAGEPE